MKRTITILVSSIAIIVLLLFGTYKLMNSRTYQVLGSITSQADTGRKAVALTFDDGPTGHVEQLLPLLDKYHAKATFFLIGKELENHMEEGRSIAAAGHQIGNHTYSHNRMVFKSPSYIRQEIEKTNALIRETGYQGVIDFRPPNGKKLFGLPYYLKTHDMRTITWSLEPDTFYTSVSDKVDYVNKYAVPGSIILLHPMYDQTGNELAAIEGILDGLSKRGFHLVTINELLE
ncbi:polysaccharide deacetylase family protein [Paenibacillus thalictri]|uniref:Polysaccharide deacetylase n=1 Tax=Paenibacillus thalictri TaxID=2527873 RepID=A0A4Q9DQE5_9BACL|nr:polysaccharide deacetylase family protein [Paenibacillus thalictri]TBL78656.1 polysaccharide deacetylase [Paenibacillus thalictri]